MKNILKDQPIFEIVNNIIIQIKYRTTHRYHILDLRDGGNGYDVGWYDSDQQILQANFLILKNYVEKEQPFKHIDWNCNKEMKSVAEEIKILYGWWVDGRSKEYEAVWSEWKKRDCSYHFETAEDNLLKFVWTGDDNSDLHKKEHELSEKDTEMLIRLIKIRKYLWT